MINLTIYARNNGHQTVKLLYYLQDFEGDGKNHLWAIDATSIEKAEARDLTPGKNVKASNLIINKRFKDEISCGTNERDPMCFDIYLSQNMPKLEFQARLKMNRVTSDGLELVAYLTRADTKKKNHWFYWYTEAHGKETFGGLIPVRNSLPIEVMLLYKWIIVPQPRKGCSPVQDDGRTLPRRAENTSYHAGCLRVRLISSSKHDDD